MPALVEPDRLSEDIANKIHDFNSDTFKWVLSNTAPAVGSTFDLGNITQIATGNGYTQMTDGAGGLVATVGFSRSGQITTVATSNAPVLTASGGTIGPFQYLFLVNDTPTLNPVICWTTLTAAVTLQISDTFTVPASNIMTINS